MKEANPHLSVAQAYHLTVHGINQNEDGSYSWKFDNYIRAFPSGGLRLEDTEYILSQIGCPTLLVYGDESDASNPALDGRDKIFQNARVESVANAGHWVHHDQLDVFLGMLREFL